MLKEFAKKINGKEYGYLQFTIEEEQYAKDNGIVIVYGCSDDLMEFQGAIDDEAVCFEGGDVWFSKEECYCEREISEKYPNCIHAVWCGDGRKATWTYDTEIPHEKFIIYKNREAYCEGIVFFLDDLK